MGVDFSNRRRNKLNGYVKEASVVDDVVDLLLVTTENSACCCARRECQNPYLGLGKKLSSSLAPTVGNCPKYITVRQLVPAARRPEPAVPLGRALSPAARALLAACSTAFLTTVHEDAATPGDSDLGFNHRGGPPGFMRCFEDGAGVSHLVIPDYSGNQLYQSLGNVQADPRVGLVALDFATGDALHVTGRARNVFDGDAEALMPRVTLLTLLEVDEALLIRAALPLRLIGPEQYSPYNPPLRLLMGELEAAGRGPVALGGAAGGDAAGAPTAAHSPPSCFQKK